MVVPKSIRVIVRADTVLVLPHDVAKRLVMDKQATYETADDAVDAAEATDIEKENDNGQ